jgi:hypothetical protein
LVIGRPYKKLYVAIFIPPEIMTINSISYYNDDDWVEICPALTEDKQGNIRLTFLS